MGKRQRAREREAGERKQPNEKKPESPVAVEILDEVKPTIEFKYFAAPDEIFAQDAFEKSLGETISVKDFGYNYLATEDKIVREAKLVSYEVVEDGRAVIFNLEGE